MDSRAGNTINWVIDCLIELYQSFIDRFAKPKIKMSSKLYWNRIMNDHNFISKLKSTHDRRFFLTKLFQNRIFWWICSYQNYGYYNKKTNTHFFLYFPFCLLLHFEKLKKSSSSITTIHIFFLLETKLLMIVQRKEVLHIIKLDLSVVERSTYHTFNIFFRFLEMFLCFFWIISSCLSMKNGQGLLYFFSKSEEVTV